MITEIKGDLIKLFNDCQFNVIAHGCNCQCKMESGIAKTIKDKWAEVYEVDCKTELGDVKKLGNFTKTLVNLDCGKQGLIYNLYTQFQYGSDGKLYLNYPALELSIQKMIWLENKNKIGLPKIGCGLAGGNWDIVKEIINRFAIRYKANITIVSLE